MPSQQAVGSDSDEDFHDAISSPIGFDPKGSKVSLRSTKLSTGTVPTTNGHAPHIVPVVEGIEVANDDDAPEDLPPPEHPLDSMQGPFEESILESSTHTKRPTSARVNAEARRQKLLNSQRYDESWTTRWRQRPDAKYHPLLKLVSQITFGMHLLQQNQAKSDQEVVKILQSHVDEVDNFLERTTEDFDLAIKDVEERIQFLQLPMQHVKVFEVMLDDKQFRTQLLDGNDKIEKIIDRTARSMNAALLDVQKGRQATRELGKYLNHVQFTWPSDRADLEAVYIAMRGNEEGWKKCYRTLQAKGNALGNKLIELGTVVSEMSKIAAAASRRNAPQIRPRSSGTSSVASSMMLRSRYNVDSQTAYMSTPIKDKPLPQAPAVNGSASQPQRPASFHQRSDKSHGSTLHKPTKIEHAQVPERPKTSSGPQSATGKDGTFSTGRRASLALSSHPPDTPRPKSAGNDTARSSKPKSISENQRVASNAKTAQHSRANSAISSSKTESGNRDSFLSGTKDLLEKSSFGRRWSMRRKHPGPTPDDTEQPAKPKVTARAYVQSQPPTPRLAPVQEQSSKASLDRANVVATQSSPQIARLPPPEPKSRTNSMRFSRPESMQKLGSSSRAPSTHTGAESISVASSIKRRTMSLKGIFSRRSRIGPVDA